MNYNKIIKKALLRLIKNDSFLIEKDLYEICITHKLAEHLQKLLKKFNVDCEYNRHIDNQKTIKEKFLKTLEKEDFIKRFGKENIERLQDIKIQNKDGNLTLSFKGKTKKVRPDIIVHLRGKNENKIVIEAKKCNVLKQDEITDLAKLYIFTDKNGNYKYDIGYYIVFPKKFSDNPIIDFEEIIKDKVYKIKIN